jgi:hypothetical protein
MHDACTDQIEVVLRNGRLLRAGVRALGRQQHEGVVRPVGQLGQRGPGALAQQRPRLRTKSAMRCFCAAKACSMLKRI